MLSGLWSCWWGGLTARKPSLLYIQNGHQTGSINKQRGTNGGTERLSIISPCPVLVYGRLGYTQITRRLAFFFAKDLSVPRAITLAVSWSNLISERANWGKAGIGAPPHALISPTLHSHDWLCYESVQATPVPGLLLVERGHSHVNWKEVGDYYRLELMGTQHVSKDRESRSEENKLFTTYSEPPKCQTDSHRDLSSQRPNPDSC